MSTFRRKSPARPSPEAPVAGPGVRGSAAGPGGRGEGLRSLLSPRSVVGKLFILQLAIVVLLAGGALATLLYNLQHNSKETARIRSLAVAEGFAHSPGIAAAMKSPDPTALLQPRALAAAKGSGVDYVSVQNRDGIRYAASTPALIGKRSPTDLAPLLAGHTVQTTDTGVLGPRVRAEVPVRDTDGTVIGAVGAGVRINSISSAVNRQLPWLLGATAAAVALATGGTALLSRRLLRQTHGMGPSEITRMYEHHDAVLHAAREGLLIVDGERRLLLANDEARRLLDLPPDAEGRLVGELGLAPATADLLASGRTASDEVLLVGARVLAVNQRPIERPGGPQGTVATFRDSTELQEVSARAEAAQKRLKVLYDASLRIGTTPDVTHTSQELADVAAPDFADFVTVDLVEGVVAGDEPAGGERALLRAATAGFDERTPLSPQGALIRLDAHGPQNRAMAGRRGVIEADLRTADAWARQDPERARLVVEHGIHSMISTPLHARGVMLGVASFWRCRRPDPFDDNDLAVANELAGRTAISIDNARRHVREHTMAVTLQRSLLPSSLPEQDALDVAFRYLPARENVGGDWFDVIPLPGARVALVVGDVVGQGLHAAATMGRLRTAVHNFSALDLPPDELLARLDEVAALIDRNEEQEADTDPVVGATCLYAVYDPVAGHCSLARAGHLPPALVRPDGTVEFLDLPAGPPLGTGGRPFVAAEVDVPEGSKLVLYTDGLVEDRHRDIDAGLQRLRAALSAAEGTAEQVCGAVVTAMLPQRPSDDTALLVAQTRLLPPDRVRSWQVPHDPAAVGAVRNDVTQALAAWDLEEPGFMTELILSELVTNAIRYGNPPIGVRLLLDRRLICEVSDGSSTSPHLRYAAATDEGGRGLFLVDQIADRWGARYTPGGKVIWAEQPLPDGYRHPAPEHQPVDPPPADPEPAGHTA